MTPLVLLTAVTLALGGILATALVAREHQIADGPSVPAGSPALDTLARQVASLTDALTDLDTAPERRDDGAPTLSILEPRPDDVPEVIESPPPAPRLDRLDRPDLHRVDQHRVDQDPCYEALARDLAVEGLDLEAVVARWAADLRLLAPLLADHEEELATVLAAGTLPLETDRSLPVDARALLGSVREAACALAGHRLDKVPLVLGPLPVELAASVAETYEPVVHDDPDTLRELARTGTERSLALAEREPVAARQAAWEADLAAFDAVLLGSARRSGDHRLASVRLRRRLALASLRCERDPDQLASTTSASLPDDVRRVRAVLTAVVEPHERATLATTFGDRSLS